MNADASCHELPGVGTLYMFPSDRFKTGTLSILTVLPPDEIRTPTERLLFSVLCRGTERYPTIAALNRRMDELYAAGLSVRSVRYGNQQVFGFRADFLDSAYIPDGTDVFGGVLDLIEQILFYPRLENGQFLSSYLESERKLQLDAIRAARKDPQAYAVRCCQKLLFGKDPSSISTLGEASTVSALTSEDLMREQFRLFGDRGDSTGQPLSFVYTGSEPPSAVIERLLQRFGEYRSGVRSNILTPIPTGNGALLQTEGAMPVSQGRLVIAIPTGVTLTSRLFFAMLVANEMLGVSPASKLFVEVREKRSLCYHCSSSYDLYKGVVYITCGIQNENCEAAKAEILRQLRLLGEGDFTDNDVLLAKRSLGNAYCQIPDSPAAMEGYYFGRSLFGVSTTVEETIRQIWQVSREEILLAAQSMAPAVLYFLRGDLTKDGEEEDDADRQ